MEGNQAMLLLERAGNLINYVGVQDEEVLECLTNIVTVLMLFKTVVKSCFGVKLNMAYKLAIENFCVKYRELPGITYPPKFHLVETHVAEFLDRHGDGTQGLGVWSEQAMESCHSDFKKFWSQVGFDKVVSLLVCYWSVFTNSCL